MTKKTWQARVIRTAAVEERQPADTTGARRPTGASDAEEPKIRNVGEWTVPKIEQAKRLADAGDLRMAASLWERVMGDPRALGPLQALVGVASLPLELESAIKGAADDTQDPQVEALEEDWHLMYPEDVLGEAIRWMMGLGICPMHVREWRPAESGRLLPVNEVWSPEHLKWDESLKGWRIRVEGNTMGVPLEPGDAEWLLFTPYGRKRPQAKAPWYGLGMLWFAAQCAVIDWADWNDTHAKPHKAASNEKAETHGLVDEEGQQQLVAIMQNLVRGGSICMPDGYKLQLLETTSQNWQSFVRLCHEVFPITLAITLTGGNLSTQVEGGSYAAAQAHVNQVEGSRKRTVAETLTTTLRDQQLVWWSEFNFGDPRRTPWAKLETTPPADLTEEANRANLTAQTLATLDSAGWAVEQGEEDKIAERLGFRVFRVRAPGAPPPAPAETPNPELDRGRAFDLTRAVLGTRAAKGLASGEEYITDLEQEALEAGTRALRPDVRELLELIRGADDLPSLRIAVVDRFSDMDPAAFAEVVERTELLAAMSGRYSATEET